MKITLVKAGQKNDEDRDRAYIEVDGDIRRAAVHVVHDLPHLVVESLFGIVDGLWAELAQGLHGQSNRAATAREPRREKQGRIVSGAASGARTKEWLSEGHRTAKTVTNAVVNRWGDGPDTPSGVRSRLAQVEEEAVRALMADVDYISIAAAIHGVRELERRWVVTPPGDTLRLTWPYDEIESGTSLTDWQPATRGVTTDTDRI